MPWQAPDFSRRLDVLGVSDREKEPYDRTFGGEKETLGVVVHAGPPDRRLRAQAALIGISQRKRLESNGLFRASGG